MHPIRNLCRRLCIALITLFVPFFILSTPACITALTDNNVAVETIDIKVSHTLNDTIPPTAICQDINVFLDFDGNVSISASDIDGGSSDECGMVTFSASQTSFDCSDNGPNFVTLTVTDCSENTSTCMATVTVLDNTAPVAICLQNLNVYLDETGLASITPSDIDGGSYDNCGGVELSLSKSNFSCSDLGMNEVTLTAADSTGNTSFCLTNLNVLDTISPVLSCVPPFSLYLDESGNASITFEDIILASSDNCGLDSISAFQTLFTCADLGANNITVTVADENGNLATCQTNVTVQDTIAPNVICLQGIAVPLDFMGDFNLSPNDLDAGSSDNCGNLTFSASQTQFTCDDIGSSDIFLTANDQSGNMKTCMTTIDVQDNTAPVAICLQNLNVYLDETGFVSITPSDIDGGSYDNCGGVDLSLSKSNFSCSDLGMNEVTLTAADSTGNTSFCLTNVHVLDTISPVLSCVPPFSLYLDESGNASITFEDIILASSDNCGLDSISAFQTLFTCADLGANNITVTVADENGNLATCQTNVTVQDTIAPNVICLQGIAVPLDFMGNFNLSPNDLDAGSSDNCGNLSLSASQTQFTCEDIGSNDVVLTAIDESGNMKTCMTTINVQDNTAPVAICLQNLNVYLDETGFASITPSDIDGGSYDNCGGVDLSLSKSNFSCPDLGMNEVTLTAADSIGNVAFCITNVHVFDTIPPIAVCIEELSVYLDGSGNASIDPIDLNGGSSDNCATIIFTASQTEFTCEDTITNIVVMTVTDGNGNMSTCQTNFVVYDTNAVSLTCQELTVFLDITGNITINPDDLIVDASDGCGSLTVSASQTEFSCDDIGGNNVVVTAVDENGNVDSCITLVFVEDEISPTIVCQDITINVDYNGMVSIDPYDIDDGSYDNCGTVYFGISNTTFTCDDIGPNLVTLAASDDSGNVNYCTATVVVQDTSIVCPWPSVYVYVDSSKIAGTNMGIDWINAFLTLEEALLAASQYSNIEEIWVAGATYYPTAGTNRNLSYNMIDDIKIYGGFAGDEALLSERDIVANPTILSGDIGESDDMSDNSYQLISVFSSVASAILDGFIIQNGNANDTIGTKDKGAGIYCEGQIKVENCTIKNCQSIAGAAAVQNNGMNGDVILKNCTIENNDSAVGDDIENNNGAGMTFQGNNIIKD